MIADRACYERGCACYDPRVDSDGVEVVEKREWVGLTDEDRQAAFESLPDMLDGFLKKWGWLHFSKAIEAKLKEKNT